MEKLLEIINKIKKNEKIKDDKIKESLILHLIIVYQYLKEFKIEI